MGDLSKNFSRSEFACKCGCGFDTVDVKLVEGLQRLRDMTEEVVTIESGCRCKEHNRKVGGVDTSQHRLGRAADITVEDVDPKEVAELLEFIMPSGGIGRYASFTHVDSRNNKARWKG